MVLTIMNVLISALGIVVAMRARRNFKRFVEITNQTNAAMMTLHAEMVQRHVDMLLEQAQVIENMTAKLSGVPVPYPAVVQRLWYPDAIPTDGREVPRGSSTAVVHVPQRVRPQDRARWEQRATVIGGVGIMLGVALMIFAPWFIWFHP